MPDWLAPFHLPKFTNETFEKKKAAYTKEHGFTITVPSLGDIIHLKPFKPLTAIEKKHYRAGTTQSIPPKRLQEIKKYKTKMRKKYEAMLASPSPKVIRDAGAILTALDDLQDALSTVATIGLIAATVIGGTTAAVLTGPLGWIIGAGVILNLINPFSRLRGGLLKKKSGRGAKKLIEKITGKNPFSKKARARYVKNILKFRPSIGNLIEVAQTTDQIFGIGISIGPIMGFVQDLAAGGVRKILGQRVGFSAEAILPDQKTMNAVKSAIGLSGAVAKKVPEHVNQAIRGMKAAAIMNSYRWESDIEDMSNVYIVANLAMQVLEPYQRDFNVFEEVPDLQNWEIKAPAITNPIIREIILESGHTIEEYEHWPQNGKQWISYAELYDTTHNQAAENLVHFGESNKHSNLAFMAANNAHDFAFGFLEAIEGPGAVEMIYSHPERTAIIILDNGWIYPDQVTPPQIQIFEDWIAVHEYNDTQPSAKEIQHFVRTYAGFEFIKSPETFR